MKALARAQQLAKEQGKELNEVRPAASSASQSASWSACVVGWEVSTSSYTSQKPLQLLQAAKPQAAKQLHTRYCLGVAMGMNVCGLEHGLRQLCVEDVLLLPPPLRPPLRLC